MKKLVLGLAMLGLLTSSAHAKKVTTCMSYLVGATSEMTCSGDYSGKTTMQKLYKKVGSLLETLVEQVNLF